MLRLDGNGSCSGNENDDVENNANDNCDNDVDNHIINVAIGLKW